MTELIREHLESLNRQIETFANDLALARFYGEEDWNKVWDLLVYVKRAFDGASVATARTYLWMKTGRHVSSGKGAMLELLKLRVGQSVPKEELALIAGIEEWARRLRELRREQGWPLREVGAGVQSAYCLDDLQPDPQVAAEWEELHGIRGRKTTVKERILTLLRKRISVPVTAEELSYVARSETWARSLNELRYIDGYPISGQADREDLDEDEFVLESERLLHPSDRSVSEEVRSRVIAADHRRCVRCRWMQGSTLDRWLEVHRETEGETLDNFWTLCSVCHDSYHTHGPFPVRLEHRQRSVKAKDWEVFIGKRLPAEIPPERASLFVYRMLLTPTEVGGRPLPHIREINSLRGKTTWRQRVERAEEYLCKILGESWHKEVGAGPLELGGTAGDGFEQILKALIERSSHRPAHTKYRLDQVPHFNWGREDIRDVDVYTTANSGIPVLLSCKWSLRGDRLRQCQNEAKALATLSVPYHFAVVTNETDSTRLAPLVKDPLIHAVYHVDKALLEYMYPNGTEHQLGIISATRSLPDLIKSLKFGPDGV